MKSHEQQCDALILTLTRAATLLVRVRAGDVQAAEELQRMCGTSAYEGHVLHIRLDGVLAPVLEPEEVA